MRPAALIGVVLLVAGVLAFVVPGITYTQRRHSVDLGPIHATETSREVWPVPRALAGIAVGARAALTGPGLRGPATWRLAGGLLAGVLVLVTATVGARQFGARAGWLAAGVLATSLALPMASRTDGTQVIATLLGWIGCAGLADV